MEGKKRDSWLISKGRAVGLGWDWKLCQERLGKMIWIISGWFHSVFDHKLTAAGFQIFTQHESIWDELINTFFWPIEIQGTFSSLHHEAEHKAWKQSKTACQKWTITPSSDSKTLSCKHLISWESYHIIVLLKRYNGAHTWLPYRGKGSYYWELLKIPQMFHTSFVTT